MDELLEIIANANTEQKANLLSEVLEYEELGIDYLIESLDDSELIVRAKAYELLQDIESEEVQQAISQGLLLNSGDKIYCLAQNSISFNDESYSVYPSKIKPQKLTTYDDYINRGFKIINFDQSASIITYLPYYIELNEAKVAAESLHRQIISKFSITSFIMHRENNPEVIKNWCANHKVSYEDIVSLQIEQDKKLGIKEWYTAKDFERYYQELHYISWEIVVDYLNSIPNQNLLSQLWKDIVGSFTNIREITFNKKTYLKLDPYFSEIFLNTNNVRYLGEDEFESESTEETEINFLIQALDNAQLKVRNTAYQLLKGIDSKRVKKAINQGVKLNSGDKIYSVYRAGFWFTDTKYLLFDGVDYLENVREQIYGEQEFDEQEQAARSKRIFCFIDKEKAEKIAELLHRESIQKSGIGIGGFEWRKENPDFDIKQWCKENNIEFKTEWEKRSRWDNLAHDYQIIMEVKKLIYASQNEELEDNFRRARYIYHPEHIDTWCKDNNVFYYDSIKYRDRNYWQNYRKIIDYIYLPENIDLLSKFWKDGVGHFAFVKEEFIQKATYVKLGENLVKQSSSQDKIELIAKPKNYDELVTDFLIRILKVANTTTKLKAYKMLQTLNTDKAKEELAKGFMIKQNEQIEITQQDNYPNNNQNKNLPNQNLMDNQGEDIPF